MERDETERSEFLRKIETIPKNTIVYVDETGLNDNEIPPMAWAHSGVRAAGARSGRRHQRVSVAASLKAGKLTSALVLDSPFNGSSFEEFVSKALLKNCCPGDTIIMDNATIHRS